MTKREVRQLVSSLQQRMGLSAWDVGVEFDSPDADGSKASMFWAYQYESGTVAFPVGWREYPDEEMVQLVIHELGHLVCRDLEMTMKAAAATMPKAAYRQWKLRYEHEIEGVIDRYATMLAREILR